MPCSRSMAAAVLIPTFSPQGDGNCFFHCFNFQFLVKLIPTFSPQGDGNDEAVGRLVYKGVG